MEAGEMGDFLTAALIGGRRLKRPFLKRSKKRPDISIQKIVEKLGVVDGLFLPRAEKAKYARARSHFHRST